MHDDTLKSVEEVNTYLAENRDIHSKVLIRAIGSLKNYRQTMTCLRVRA